MTYLTLFIYIASGVSLVLNIALVWYIFHAVRQIKKSEQYAYMVTEELISLEDMIQTYLNHIEVVNQMEMFYGDETLRDLIRHGKSLVEAFKEYKIEYSPLLEMEEEINYDNKSESEVHRDQA